jgi:hypothetical protein
MQLATDVFFNLLHLAQSAVAHELRDGGITSIDAGVVVGPDGEQQVVLTITNSAWDAGTAMKCAQEISAMVGDHIEEDGVYLYGITPPEFN